MKELLKDKEHLVRMGLLFLGGTLAFMVARIIFVPKGYGMYGQYRAGALDDNRSRPLSFAGRAACEDCHSDISEARAGSKHAGIGCEACHRALAKHAEDPEKVKPVRPDAQSVCLVCHEVNVAKPRGFPQVEPKEHAEEQPCNTCHLPHHPEKSPDEPAEETPVEVQQ
ncbi:MAG: cytochrome c3 family protein [Acidobacteriota bacterium]